MKKIKNVIITMILIASSTYFITTNEKSSEPESSLVNIYIAVHAQEDLFHPSINNYTYRDYQAGTSNWWAIEDDRGIMYVANREGIIEYDGKNWTLIESPEQEVARSLAKDDAGVIYAGFVGDIGYLAPNEMGEMQFVSLKNKILC